MKRRIVLVIVDLLVIAAWVGGWAVVAFAQRIDAGSPAGLFIPEGKSGS